MIKVVSFKICPFVQRVTAALEAKQVPYSVEYISLKEKPQWFLEVSPNAQVPLLITESGTALFESDAIVEYLEERFGPMETGASAEQRALDRAWSYLGSKQYLIQCSAMRSSDKATLAERSAKLASAFAKVEQQIEAGPYFKGKALSTVDLAWLPVLHRAAIVEQRSGYDFLAGFPRVKAWQQALLATGLAERSVPEDFEQRFSDFYLSNETYFGAGSCCHSEAGSASSRDSCC